MKYLYSSVLETKGKALKSLSHCKTFIFKMISWFSNHNLSDWFNLGITRLDIIKLAQLIEFYVLNKLITLIINTKSHNMFVHWKY